MVGVNVSNLCKYYWVNGRRVEALKDFETRIAPGETVSVVGYSGCGKTTFLRLLSGLEAADGGCIAFSTPDGRPTGPGRIGMVFQEHRLLPWLTVEKNLLLALRHTVGPAQAMPIVDRTLELIGIPDFRKAYPGQLSGGMAQRAALGRALCRQPELLLMDEPFGALDALTRHKLRHELLGVFTNRRVTIVLVTHDVSEAVLLGDRVLVVKKGRVFEELAVPFAYPRDESSLEFVRLRDRVLNSILLN